MESPALEDASTAYAMQLQLEDSQTHISDLLEMLAMENFAEESTQASSIINSMGSVLDKFSDNRFDFQSEMNAMLESSRRGMLTHTQLSELVTAEANRSHHLSNILNSLRFQIENMHDALADLRDSALELDEDAQTELNTSTTRLAMKVNLIMKSVLSMDRIATAPVKKLPAAIACIDSEVVMHVNKTKLEGKSPINAGNKPVSAPAKPSKHASILPAHAAPAQEPAAEGAVPAEPIPLTGDLAALDPAKATGVAPPVKTVPVETRNFGCQVNIQQRSPTGEAERRRPTNRPPGDITVDLPYSDSPNSLTPTGEAGAARRSLRQNGAPSTGQGGTADSHAGAPPRDDSHGAHTEHGGDHDHDHDHDGAVDLHYASGDDGNSVESGMTQDSKAPLHPKTGGKHAKDKKHTSSKKKASAPHSLKSHGNAKHGAESHHIERSGSGDNHPDDHAAAAHHGDSGGSVARSSKPAAAAAADAHSHSHAGKSNVPRPSDHHSTKDAGSHQSSEHQSSRSAGVHHNPGIATDHRSSSPALGLRSETPDDHPPSEKATVNRCSFEAGAVQRAETPDVDSAHVGTTAAARTSASPGTASFNLDGTATSGQANSLSASIVHAQVSVPGPISTATSSSAPRREDASGMSALRNLSEAELEEKLQGVVEFEVRRRVKIALNAAAAKDYNGFSAAIGSKSPHSRQTFAQYTGRPVSREVSTPERNSSGSGSGGDDRMGLDSSRASQGGVPGQFPGFGSAGHNSDFAPPLSSSGKKTVTIMDRSPTSGGARAAGAEQHWTGASSAEISHIVPTMYSHAKPGIIQNPSMLSMDSGVSLSDYVSPAVLSTASVSVPSGYGVPPKITVEHLIKDEALEAPHITADHRAGATSPGRIINTPPPTAPQPGVSTTTYISGAGIGSGANFDAEIHGRGFHAPSESLQLESMDYGSNVHGPGKLVLEDSNVITHEIALKNTTSHEGDARVRRKMDDARRRGAGMSDDDSVQSVEFKRFLEAEAKAEKAKRAAAGVAANAPSKVEIYHQIFQTTKDPKKLELIKIQVPEASHPTERGAAAGTALGKDALAASNTQNPKQPQTEAQIIGTATTSDIALDPTNPHASWIDLSSSDVLLPGKVPPGHPPTSAMGTMRTGKVARAFKDAEIATIKNALSKALESDTYSYLLSQLEKLFAQGSQANPTGAQPVELPIYDNQGGILLTRTYRSQTPPATFVEMLSSSDNPLLCLHQEYASFLSKNHRLRLLNAAVQEDRLRSDAPQSKSVQQLLGLLLENVLTLVKDCNEMLSLMGTCEGRVATMVELLRRKPDYLSVVLSSPQIVELYGFFGQIESLKLCVDLKLIEFRSIFERVNAQSMHEIEHLMRESSDFEYCYKHFLACQGKSVELNQRLTMCKDRCVRYNLGTNSDKKKKRPKIEFDDQTSLGMGGPEGQMQEIQDLRGEIEDLQEQLATAREEYEDQEVEMLEMLQERDRSPDALLFFAIMHDPSYLTNLQQMILQMSHLKSFADGTGHMDFMTLRKRIQVCVVLVPSVKKLVDRYSAMYQKWAAFRLNWFSARKLNGGSADAFNSCPLCFQCVSPDGDSDSPKKAAKTLAVTGMDRTALQRQNKQMRQSASLKELKQSRPPAGLDEMSTISSPDKPKIHFTLPNIK